MARQDKKDLRVVVAANIKIKMQTLGIDSYKELSALADVSPSMVSTILGGKTSPRVDTIQRIAGADIEIVTDRIVVEILTLITQIGRIKRTGIICIAGEIPVGILKIIHFYSEVRVREIPEHEIRQFDPALRSFVNLNTPEERKLAASLDVLSSVRKPS